MVDETYNPWTVTCIDSFNFLCCPECVYRSKEESSFQSHAIQNHPKSEAFFKPESTIESEVEVHVFYCCPECDYKSKDVNVFQIHALEKHPTSLSFFTREETHNSSSKFLASNLLLFLIFSSIFDKCLIYATDANPNHTSYRNFHFIEFVANASEKK